jgi:hypothetical protein
MRFHNGAPSKVHEATQSPLTSPASRKDAQRKSRKSAVALASACIVVRSCAEVFGAESADTDDRKMCDVLHHHLAKGGVPPACWIPLLLARARHRASCASRGAFGLPRASLPHDQPLRRVGCAANLIAVGSRPGGFRADPGPHDQGHFIAAWTLDQPSAGWMPPTFRRWIAFGLVASRSPRSAQARR